jgi:hypothetical protein
MSAVQAERLRFTQAVLWLDPGESTGWATWIGWQPLDRDTFDGAGRFFSGQGPRHVVCRDLDHLLHEHRAELKLGWEAYLLTPGGLHGDPVALKVIGVLEYLANRHVVEVLRPQPSSTRLLGADKLMAVSWHRPGERDANAAAAHLLTYLLATKRLNRNLTQLIEALLRSDADGEG